MTQGPSLPRRTLRSPAQLSGVSLFTAAHCDLVLSPAPARTGIRFKLDSDEALAHIASLSTDPIHPAFASVPPRCTCLRTPSGQIGTVEHVLAALTGLGITDAAISLTAPELPIFDGSALPVVQAILGAGIEDLGATITALRPPRRLRVESDDGSASIEIEPADAPHYTYELDFGSKSPIPAASAHWSGDPDEFVQQVAPARTFSLESEAQTMRRLGLFTHFTPRDMLVIGPSGPIDNTLRFPDEPARHKLLDLIGDLTLAGRPLCARVRAVRSGHALNHTAARALLDSMN